MGTGLLATLIVLVASASVALAAGDPPVCTENDDGACAANDGDGEARVPSFDAKNDIPAIDEDTLFDVAAPETLSLEDLPFRLFDDEPETTWKGNDWGPKPPKEQSSPAISDSRTHRFSCAR